MLVLTPITLSPSKRKAGFIRATLLDPLAPLPPTSRLAKASHLYAGSYVHSRVALSVVATTSHARCLLSSHSSFSFIAASALLIALLWLPALLSLLGLSKASLASVVPSALKERLNYNWLGDSPACLTMTHCASGGYPCLELPSLTERTMYTCLVPKRAGIPCVQCLVYGANS